MQTYESTPCVNKALNVKYGRKTVAHDVYSRLYQRAYRFCFQTACWSVDGVNRAVDVVSQITHQCQAEVKLFMEKAESENAKCSEQCSQALRAFDNDKCASHTIRHLPKSAEEKKFFWNVYAWAYDVCILKDQEMSQPLGNRDICSTSSSEQMLSRSAGIDLVRECKGLRSSVCTTACFSAYEAFQASRCREWAIGQLSSTQREETFEHLRDAKTHCTSKILAQTSHDRTVVEQRAVQHQIHAPQTRGIPHEERELDAMVSAFFLLRIFAPVTRGELPCISSMHPEQAVFIQVHPPAFAPPPLAPAVQAPGPVIVPHTEVSFACNSPNGMQQAEVVIETVQLACESEAAAFADEIQTSCRPPCQSALKRCATSTNWAWIHPARHKLHDACRG